MYQNFKKMYIPFDSRFHNVSVFQENNQIKTQRFIYKRYSPWYNISKKIGNNCIVQLIEDWLNKL